MKKSGSNRSVSRSVEHDTMLTYFRALRQKVIAQFRAEPFGLSRANAEECANEVMKVVKRNHRDARHA